MNQKFHPYVVFLPSKQKHKILRAIFGSKAAVDILKFSIDQGISNKIYQKDLVKKLSYSNKTIIEHLKSLTKLGVLEEGMEKIERENRIVWLKSYQLTDIGKWFVLLLAEEKELTKEEKAKILRNIFKAYVRWVKTISEKLELNKEELKKIFDEEIR
jgi:DNA-binding transcriptional ArsR family regulator